MNSLSVIIPAYNAEKYLAAAVDSVRAQELGGSVEIIVTDDGSTDRTAAIAQELGCRMFSIPHSGAAAARNLGIEKASGDYLLFLDADDVLIRDALSVLFDAMLSDKTVDVVFGTAKDFVSPDLSDEEAAKLAPRKEPYTGMVNGAALLKKEAVKKVGPFDTGLQSGETVDWMMRLRSSDVRTMQTDTLVLLRRLHLSNSGRTAREAEMASYAAILRKRMKQK